jgi:hypothetical protein
MTDIVLTKADKEAGKIKQIEEYNFRSNLRTVTFAHKAPGEYSFMRDEKGSIVGIQLVKEPIPTEVPEFAENTKLAAAPKIDPAVLSALLQKPRGAN